jgi:hypothetical protein
VSDVRPLQKLDFKNALPKEEITDIVEGIKARYTPEHFEQMGIKRGKSTALQLRRFTSHPTHHSQGVG